MSRTFYVTTPIYYVNDVPHIGHAYTTVLADVLARYHKLLDDEVFFLTGTDEHGQKVQQAAEKRGVSPQAHCDEYSERFKSAWKELNIDNDEFIRTTNPKHIKYVQEKLQELWDKALPNGDALIYPKEYSGWYSTSEERFFSEDELVDGKDPISGRAVEWIVEKNYFFRMSAFQEQLIRHVETTDYILPDFRRNEVLGFLRQPLKDLCISRPKSRLAWGISLPFDEDYVAYVWIDALLNYASAVEGRSWSNGKPVWPADFHLIGKDILTTHAVYWTTLLMALEMDLPKHILAHGWWMIDNARMSKTTGNVVSPLAMKDKYGVDAFRFFLIREMAVGADASFSEDVFVGKLNSDLANDVGNGLSRVLKLAESLGSTLNFSQTNFEEYESYANSSASAQLQFLAYNSLKNIVGAVFRETPTMVEKVFLSFTLDSILQIFGTLNRYLEVSTPWKLAKGGDEEKKLLNAVLWNSAEALRIGFTWLHPVMPVKMEEALNVLGWTFEKSRTQLEWRKEGAFSLKTVPPLFPRVEVKVEPIKVVAKSENRDPFSNVELRVVKILSVEDHPNAEALYVLRVDVANEIRTVCAGLKRHLSKEELVGKIGVLVANLKPASLRGIDSQGMLLAAEGESGKLSLVNPDGAVSGQSIFAEGLTSNPNSQITLKEFEKCSLKVENGAVYYGARPLRSPMGPVLANAPDGAVVR